MENKFKEEYLIDSSTDINGNADWPMVRMDLEQILSEFGYPVPNRDDAIEFWRLRSEGVLH